MIIAIVVITTVVLLAATAFLLVRWNQMRGARAITCPENREIAAVEVDAARAALTSIFRGQTVYQLTSCSRWPEKEGCGQECVAEIVSTPSHCLVRTILADWYLGRNCVFCGKAFGEVNWHDHKPGLYDPERKTTLQWKDLRPELVWSALATFEPVCWDCDVAETFRARHPELVTDRRRPRSGATA